MNLAKKLWMTTGDSSGGLAPSGGYVDDVFSTYVYKGNGVNRSFVTGQNLLADGGMVWTKGRSGTYGATDHYLFHTERGSDIFLSTNTTNGQGAFTAGTSVSSFNNGGFSLGTSPYVNDSATEYVSWVFKNAPKFYGHQVVTKSTGSNVSVNFPELVTLGMVRVKKIDSTGSWYVWHRSLTAGQLILGEGTGAAATLGHVTVSGTTVTLVNGVIANGSYLVEAFAHDASLDGIVQCGSFMTDAGGNATVNLGWEPQCVTLKASSVGSAWVTQDTMRGFSVSGASVLYPNLSITEDTGSTFYRPTATGLSIVNAPLSSSTYVYLVIRRPNKPPTSGTQVYNASTASGVVSAGFPIDLHIGATRAGAASNHAMHARLTGGTRELVTSSTAAEATITDLGFDSMTGLRASLSAGGVNHFFRRAPGFMDVVCYTGDSGVAFRNHNLGVKPELVIIKERSSVATTGNWSVEFSNNGTWAYGIYLNSTAVSVSSATFVPTTTQFPVSNISPYNLSPATYVTYLFASKPGISKVGRYSGNGSTQTIPCGFTTGSRFILIKRIDNTGDWFVWDTVRGITPTTDPHLSLNTVAAEVTTDDSIDQDASGFVVNQNAATNINALGGNYLFLAIA